MDAANEGNYYKPLFGLQNAIPNYWSIRNIGVIYGFIFIIFLLIINMAFIIHCSKALK